jgi:glutaminyl-peptide cyclotransferase
MRNLAADCQCFDKRLIVSVCQLFAVKRCIKCPLMSLSSRRTCCFLVSIVFWLAQLGCGNSPSSAQSTAGSDPSVTQAHPGGIASAPAAKTTSGEPPVYTYDVVNTFPHDRRAFTQGLIFFDGQLLESTGLYGQSSLRKVELKTGNVLQQVVVPPQYFAEGLALLNGKLYQLTWQHQKGFVYDLETFKVEKEFTYAGQGWGLTTDGHVLILSDGTERLRFFDPVTFEEKRTVTVLVTGHGLTRLNELEYVKGEVLANVWGTQYVVRIDPVTGRVVGVIDFAGLLSEQDRDWTTDVLNGIAYDAKDDRLFVTGKRWPKMFEVRLRPKK